MKWPILALILSFCFFNHAMAESEPDMSTLKNSGYVMYPGSTYYPVHKNWTKQIPVMKEVDIYDAIVSRMQEVFCSSDQNKSVLIVGEPGHTYRWLFARLATKKMPEGCEDKWHVEIDINKIEAGNRYVGDVEAYWQNKILKPADDRKVILYFSNLNQIIGLGSHSNNRNGIEAEMHSNIAAGRLKVVSFIDKYAFNRTQGTDQAYVLYTYAETINIPEIVTEQVNQLVQTFLKVHHPSLKLNEKVAAYFYKTVNYFQPNVSEPERSMMILNNLIRSAPNKSYEFTIEDVRQAIFKVVQVPQWILNRDYSVVRDLRSKLDGDVVGVKEGKKALMRQVKIGYVSGRTDEKPIGTLLFVGPTGTGKSYIAKKVAEFMEMKLITLDMTSYATPESFDRFLDTVANYLTLYPFAVYLFEEIDKADARVLDRLYFMMDEGVFYDQRQRPLFARGALILMTTNTAKNIIINNQHNPDLRRLVMAELEKDYRPSFLNRFDAIPIFYPFSDAEFRQLATIMTSKKIAKLKEFFDWDLKLGGKIIDYLAKNGRSDIFGARPMERLIENVVSIGISEFQLQIGNIPDGTQFEIIKIAGDNMFQIRVGDKKLDYEADTDINSGKSFYLNTPDLAAFFSSIRMY